MTPEHTEFRITQDDTADRYYVEERCGMFKSWRTTRCGLFKILYFPSIPAAKMWIGQEMARRAGTTIYVSQSKHVPEDAGDDNRCHHTCPLVKES